MTRAATVVVATSFIEELSLWRWHLKLTTWVCTGGTWMEQCRRIYAGSHARAQTTHVVGLWKLIERNLANYSRTSLGIIT